MVTSGQTGFPTTEVYEVPRIKYRKTVSYAEYLYKTDANNNLITDGAGITWRIPTIRCVADSAPSTHLPNFREHRRRP